MKNTNLLTDRSYWNSHYKDNKLKYKTEDILFKDVFKKYLHPYLRPGMSCFEIGCYPGRYLMYFHNEFGLTVSGIDFVTDIGRMKEFFHENNIVVDTIVNKDIMNFHSKSKYDLVYSIGFIEHFMNFEILIEKHIELLKPGGLLFIGCPNFRRIQYLLHLILDKENLDKHNSASMDLNIWKKILLKNNMEIIWQKYYRTFYFWFEPSKRGYFNDKIAKYTQSFSEYIDKEINFPNPYTSPYLISISRKKN